MKKVAVIANDTSAAASGIPITVDFTRHCKGVSALSPHMNNVLCELVKSYGPQLLGAHVLGNESETDQSQFPSGMAMYFDKNAPVNPMSLSGDAIQALVMAKIVVRKDERLDDKFFVDRLQKLQAAVPQYADIPITLTHMDPATYTDADHWSEELGPSGSVGVVKKPLNAKNNAYYLYALCSTPVLGQQVVDQLAAKTPSPPTWSEFSRDPRTIFWRQSVMRNAARVLYSAAQHMGVMINTTTENGTFQETPDQAAKIVADLETEESVRQYISDICSVQTPAPAVRDAIGQFIHCAPVSKLGTAQYCLVADSPFQGFTGVRMKKFTPGASLSVFPTTTGRKTASAALDTTAVTKHELQDISTQYIWEGKPEKIADARTMNDRLHPHAYRTCDDEFLKTQFFDRGVENAFGVTERFTPVISKVANRKQRQK